MRIKPKMGAKLGRLSIEDSKAQAILKSSVLTILDDKPGEGNWRDKIDNGTPTYTVTGNWRIPEGFLKAVEA